MSAGINTSKENARVPLDDIIKNAGFSYDSKQDIFFSNIDAWQRNMGYCRLYDEAAALFGMIMDCEPIYFEYDHKRWLIEFWKGQYGMTTGCEVGVYAAEGHYLNLTGFNATFYNSVNDEDLLHMSMFIRKQGKPLFLRSERHWWLTGFMLGEFSEPSELTMKISITLKNETMRDAFIEGLTNAGYSPDEIIIKKNRVSVEFNEPRTPQPFTRIKKIEQVAQRKNKLLCNKYQEITGEHNNSLDKIKEIQETAPEIFRKIFSFRSFKQLFSKILKYPKKKY